MNILEHQQILEHEVQLLNHPGENLSSFYLYSPEQSLFISPSPHTKSTLLAKYKLNVKELKTCLNHSNTSLQIFTSLLIKLFYEGGKQLDLLQHFKCTLYSFDVKIDEIVHMPKRNLSSNIMKKILVQFFQVMQYHTGKIQPMLDKYPIVVEIFILFLRTILKNNGLQSAEDFRKSVNPQQAIPLLFDYFDIRYQMRKGLFILGEGQLVLFVDDSSTIVYGERCDKQTQPLQQVKKEGKHEEKYQNQFNFLAIGESQMLENIENPSKDLSTPTPHFPDIIEEEMNFNRRSSERQSKKRKTSFDFIQNEIKEEEEDLRDSLHSSRTNQFNNMTEEGKKLPSQQLFTAAQSPNPSIPSTDVFDFRQMRPAQSQQYNKTKRQSNSPVSVGQSVRSDRKQNKSDKFPYQDRGHKFRKKNQQQLSIYSCTCTQAKARKNSIHSSVIDIDFKKDFSKKFIYTPESKGFYFETSSSRIGSERYSKTQPRKVPDFLIRKVQYESPYQNKEKMSAIMDNSQSFSKSNNGKPKVYFTYNQPYETSLNYSTRSHIYTEPANLNSVHNPRQKADTFRRIGANELQGTPRIYRNYVQQKIKYL